jgi:hypothetical protein
MLNSRRAAILFLAGTNERASMGAPVKMHCIRASGLSGKANDAQAD